VFGEFSMFGLRDLCIYRSIDGCPTAAIPNNQIINLQSNTQIAD